MGSIGTGITVASVTNYGVGLGITVDGGTVGMRVGGTLVEVVAGAGQLPAVTITLRVGREPEHPTASAMRDRSATANGNLNLAFNQPI